MSGRKKSVINKENLCTRKYMRDKYSKSNINNVSGNVFNGPTNIVAGNNYSKKDEEDKVARYIYTGTYLEKSNNNGNTFMGGTYTFFNRAFSTI